VKKAALVAAATLAAAGPLAAQRDTVPEGRVHVVRRGDTLWDLAQQYLADPFLWPEIFRLNTDVVRDPRWIYPNERLVLPGGTAARAQEGEHTVFYRGPQDSPRDRLTILPAGSADYPVVRNGDYYRAAFLARDNEIHLLGHLAEIMSPTVVPLERAPAIQVYDKVYVPGEPGVEFRIGERVQFVRPDRELRPYGRVWTPTGVGTVANVDGNVATVVVVRMFDPVLPGDLVVPVAPFPVRAGVMPAASTGLQGRIFAFEKAHPAQAVEEIAFLDVGRQAGVKEGDEFEVFIPRERRDWGTRPEIPVARLQVVKVTDQTASARITNLQQPAIVVGQPVRRVAAMP